MAQINISKNLVVKKRPNCEDIGENIYRLDRMLTSLDLAGKF